MRSRVEKGKEMRTRAAAGAAGGRPYLEAPAVRQAYASPRASMVARSQALADSSPRLRPAWGLAAPLHQGRTTSTHGADASSRALQRVIKGTGGKGVRMILDKNRAWSKHVGTGGKAVEKYLAAIGELVDELQKWESPFEPEDIAEALRASPWTAEGVRTARSKVISGLEEHIDESILHGGHSGEKHYGKDERYQKERMKDEGKSEVTTLEDAKRTKQFLETVKRNAATDLLSTVHDMIWDLGYGLAGQHPTRTNVKAITDGHVGTSELHRYGKFAYTITLEEIVVKGAGGGGSTVKVKPKLESQGDYPKTQYTSEGSSAEDRPIVMYWGGNSPVVSIAPGDITTDGQRNYDGLYDEFEGRIKATGPVTAF